MPDEPNNVISLDAFRARKQAEIEPPRPPLRKPFSFGRMAKPRHHDEFPLVSLYRMQCKGPSEPTGVVGILGSVFGELMKGSIIGDVIAAGSRMSATITHRAPVGLS